MESDEDILSLILEKKHLIFKNAEKNRWVNEKNREAANKKQTPPKHQKRSPSLNFEMKKMK